MLDQGSALLHAANLRACWDDGDKEGVARQIVFIADLHDAQDIIIALVIQSETPTGRLREMLSRQVPG